MRELSGITVTRIAGRARAIGDPTRVRILSALTRGDCGVNGIARTIASAPTTVSKHLQVLFNSGLVIRHREASAVIYALASPDVQTCLRLLGLRLPQPVNRRAAARMETMRAGAHNAPSQRAPRQRSARRP